MNVQEIIFDDQDRTLFAVDDLQLKADAIRYSILPKLEIINHEIISRISEVYKINYFEHCSVAKTPHFRLSKTQRKEATKTDYFYSSVSLTGQRKDNKWFGLDKGKGIPPKIAPASMDVTLTDDGMDIGFFFGYPANFTKETYSRFFKFFRENAAVMTGLAMKAGMKYDFLFSNSYSVEEDLENKFKAGFYNVHFQSSPVLYPINYEKINEVILGNIFVFPILNACIQIALGNEPDLKKDLDMLEENMDAYYDKYYADKEEEEIEEAISNLIEPDINVIRQKAAAVVKVMAGIRWQVFKRDEWKCVACGRKAADDIILHVDHILPRSKGGKDDIDNYQTLCETCNIGKSNRDETDLRRKAPKQS